MRQRFLNVGGGSKQVWLPPTYAGWEHCLLDIDATVSPDICLDARELAGLDPAQFDAIYCSHNLEHYFAHDVSRVLGGFRHVLRPGGFAEVRVPDMQALMRTVVERGLDIDDVLYQSGMGPIMVRDVIYGYGRQIESSGVDFYAHKTGFTPRSLSAALKRAGFVQVGFLPGRHLEVAAVGFTAPPTEAQLALFRQPAGQETPAPGNPVPERAKAANPSAGSEGGDPS
ncbi:MAG: class I SAM-dependent methyltransferase [Gemmobacter sp.]